MFNLPSNEESSRFRSGGRTDDDWTVIMDGMMSDGRSLDARSPCNFGAGGIASDSL